jgi:isochorismate synthase
MIFKKIRAQFQKQLPFVVYNKPDSNSVIGLFQKDATLHVVEDYHEEGFIFAPFDGDTIILIPVGASETIIEPISFFPIEENTSVNFIDSDSQEEHEALVQKGIDAINKNIFSKVVLSRKEIVPLVNYDLINSFQRILNYYPSAFSYCFFHPATGLWMGAFSEQFLKIENHTLTTAALAGTQQLNGHNDVIWQHKEKEEQEIVARFIVDHLSKVISDLHYSLPYTIKAGNLAHIKTDITGILNEQHRLKEIISILHPTPAVCGYPKEAAKEFILKNESYNREFYAGFLGELNYHLQDHSTISDLFVNLRCMKIEDDKALLFMGGGITKDSIPEKEWFETVHKSMTMKRIL